MKHHQNPDGWPPEYLKGQRATLESYDGLYMFEGSFAEDVYDSEAYFLFTEVVSHETISVNGSNFSIEVEE